MRLQYMLAVALLAASASSLRAEDNTEDNICPALAGRMSGLYRNFPKLKPGTAERLLLWASSCAENPPSGAGNVTALCQAKTRSGKGVFYWTKAGTGLETSGYVLCPY